jgi:hypothetical protein
LAIDFAIVREVRPMVDFATIRETTVPQLDTLTDDEAEACSTGSPTVIH